MESKSWRRIFVGFDDGAKSIKYFNAETRKILTSRNIRFLNLTDEDPSQELIIIQPDTPCEGESEDNTLPLSGNDNNKGRILKRKRDQLNDEVYQDRRSTWVKKAVDYRYLNNPFLDEDEQDINLSDEQTFAIIPGDEITSLKEAKNSPDWPEWEKATKSELAQLKPNGNLEASPKAAECNSHSQ